MFSWAMIAGQLVLVAAALHVWRWYVLPELPRIVQRELIVDVWGPVSLVLPMLFSVVWVGYAIREDGWPLLGVPIVSGLFAVAMAAIITPGTDAQVECADRPSLGWTPSMMASIAGTVLLLLGAAHVMNIWMGQVAFALLAVVLWINTPAAQEGEASREQVRCWGGMIVIVLCGFAMGGTVMLVAESHRSLSTLIMLAYPCIAVAMAARYAGSSICARLGAWVASLGVIGALGAISIMHMAPQAVRLVLGGQPSDVRFVAYGFGAFAFEAVLLLVMPLVALAMVQLSAGGRRVVGVGVVLICVVLVAWRMSWP